MADLSRVSVLIVDDNAHMMSIVRQMLRGFGIVKVYECRDAGEAFDIARTEPVDLIIVDYHMPLLDGLEFTRLVRNGSDSGNPYMPIIMLTAYTERSRVLAARDAGVTEICAKPLNANQLWLKLCAVINEPRPFVRTPRFFGPDRRRREGFDYAGEERRADRIKAASQAPDADPDEEADDASSAAAG